MEVLNVLTSPFITLICVSIAFSPASSDQFTTVEFSPLVSPAKREVVLHPDELKVRLSLGEDGVTELKLRRQRDLDLGKIQVYVDGAEWKEQSQERNKRTSFYHDPDLSAAVSVTAEIQENGDVKRSLTGCLVAGGRAFEVYPTQSGSPQVEEYLQQRGLDKNQIHKVHLLKEFDLKSLLQRLHGKTDQANRQQNVKRDPFSDPDATRQESSNSRERVKSSDSSGSERVNDPDQQTNRSRRMASDWQTTFIVEMQFLVDDSVYRFWRSAGGNAYGHHEAIAEIKYYYAHIFNGMRLTYNKIDFYSLDLWLTNITIFTTDMDFLDNGLLTSENAFKFIWTYTQYSGFDWRYPDHVMLWTKYSLRNYDNDEILGSAYICGVCDPGYQVSVNIDEGFFGWVTGAHELGHNLGATHDSVNINGCRADDTEIYIMADAAYVLTSQNIHNALSFSPCSEAQMYDCLTGNSNLWDEEFPRVCVFNHVCESPEEIHHLDELPGAKFDLNKQCKLLLGYAEFSQNCVEKFASGDICKQLACDAGSGCDVKHSMEFRAAPGTPCGNQGQVCFEGQCVSSSSLQYNYELDPNCETVRVEIPDDCTNTQYSVLLYGSYFTCEETALSIPWKCFTDDVMQGCSRTCTEYGLFRDNNAPCNVQIVKEEPQPTTTLTPDSFNPSPPPLTGQQVVFCDTDLSDLGGVRCPSDPAHCVPIIWMCDGVRDCLAWEDEDITFCQQVPCPAEGYVRCHDEPNLCILESWLCDGTLQCPDSSDEMDSWCEGALSYCFTVFGSAYKGYNCPNAPSVCVPDVWTCDGLDDCVGEGGQDEPTDESRDFCDSLCPYGHVRCPVDAFKCIPTDFACDGEKHCAEESDEDLEWCRGIQARDCYPGYVNCPTLPYRCVHSSALCDGNNDCHDNSDESAAVCGKRKREAKSVKTFLSLIHSQSERGSVGQSDSRVLQTDKKIQRKRKQDGRSHSAKLHKRHSSYLKQLTDSQLPLDMKYLRRSASTPVKKPYVVPDNPQILDLEDLRRRLYTED